MCWKKHLFDQFSVNSPPILRQFSLSAAKNFSVGIERRTPIAFGMKDGEWCRGINEILSKLIGLAVFEANQSMRHSIWIFKWLRFCPPPFRCQSFSEVLRSKQSFAQQRALQDWKQLYRCHRPHFWVRRPTTVLRVPKTWHFECFWNCSWWSPGMNYQWWDWHELWLQMTIGRVFEMLLGLSRWCFDNISTHAWLSSDNPRVCTSRETAQFVVAQVFIAWSRLHLFLGFFHRRPMRLL